MPQLDSSNFLSQIFWLVITFGLLYQYLQRYILPKLGGVISQRASAAADDLKQAEELQNKLTLLKQEIAKESQITKEKVEAMHAEAAARIHTIKQARLDEINITFLKNRERVTSEIAEAQKAALDQMKGFVIDYAALILTKITGSEPSIKELDQYYLKLEVKS